MHIQRIQKSWREYRGFIQNETVIRDHLIKLSGTAPNPSQAGQSVTVTVGVTPASSAGALGGTVTVSGAGETCTLPATSCTLAFASNGVKRLTASYTGSGVYAGSTGAMTHYVGKKAVDLTPILMLLLD